MKRLILILATVFFLGCVSVPIEKHKRSTARYVGYLEAIEIAKEYLSRNGLQWGDPIETKLINDTFIFRYITPPTDKTKRIIHVNRYGKMSGRALRMQ